MAVSLLEHLHAALADRYAIERELGHGGMALVFLAQDLKHRRLVAIKVLRPELARALGAERFLREIEIAARLNHPHILALLDSGAGGGLLYYVMPYVEGESLRDRLTREQQLPVDQAMEIARQVASALSYAHSHDVVHRDIKPENILLQGDEVLVADFGIARAITAAGGEQLTSTGIAVGTPAYMSPEQGAGESHLDGRSDVFSLGCVLYEMLAGAPPFIGPTAQAIQARRMTDAVPSLRTVREKVPVHVEEAIVKALAKVPADRFATAARFADALARGIQSFRTPRRLAHRKLLAGGALVAVAAALLVGAALLAGRQRARGTAAASRVVVLPFENRTAVSALDPLGPMAAEWVTQGLTEVPFLTVLDTRSTQFTGQTLGAASGAVAVGRETGAGVVVAGAYFLQGDSLRLQAQIVSTADGSILLGIGGVTAPRDRPLEGIEQLRQRLVAGLAGLLNRDVTSFQTILRQPPTYAAYREYVDGLDLYMGRHYGDAALHFQQAAVLDPTFLTAGIWAAQSSALEVTIDDAWARRADSLISGLQPLRNQLASFDRARLDFVVALRAGDLQGAYRAALRLVDASPGSVDARREAAVTALRVLRPRETLRRLEELDPGRGLMREWEAAYWHFVAEAKHSLGQYEEELRASRRSRQRDPSDPLYLYCVLRALAALGRIAELDSLVRIEVPASGQAGFIAFVIAGELMAHGHAEAAHRLAQYAFDHPGAPPPGEHEAAREWLDQHNGLRGNVGDPPCYVGEHLETHSPAERSRDEWLHWRAELALLLGDTATATNLAAQLRDPGSHGPLLARILAARGNLGAAREALEQWEGHMVHSRGTLNGLEIERASVLVRLGDLDHALEVLSEGIGRRALASTATGWDGHAYSDFTPLWSDPRFRAMIKPRG